MNRKTRCCVLAAAGGLLSVAGLGCDYDESRNLETASTANFDRGSANDWHRQPNKVDHDEDGMRDDRGVMAYDDPTALRHDRVIYGYEQNQYRDQNQTQIRDTSTTRDRQQGQSQAQTVISNWPQTPQRAAQDMIQKYGQPDVVSPTMLVWNNNSPWIRTVVHRETFQHNFPMPHEDCLEQTVQFNVPVDRFDDLARFDGSIICDRTAGHMTARCHTEPMNFAALNLAYQVANGEMSVDEARREMARIATAYQNGQRDPMTQQFQFQMQGGQAGDPDQQMRGSERDR